MRLFRIAVLLAVTIGGAFPILAGPAPVDEPAKASEASCHAPSPNNHASLAAYPSAVISLKDPKTHRIFYVESNGRRLVALDDDGRVAWSVDVLTEANIKPAVGQPVIRHLQVADGWLHVICGKHDAVKVDVQTGKTRHVGANKSSAAVGPSGARLTQAKVIRLAREAAEREGIKLDRYKEPEANYEFTRKDGTWTVFFDGKVPTPGNHFMVWVNDGTKKTKVMRGE